MESKQELRKIMLAKRRQVTEEQQRQVSEAVSRRLLELLADVPDGTVLSYLAYGRELDLSPLHRELWRQGRALAVPTVANLPAGEMQAAAYLADTPLIKTNLGVQEPVQPQIVAPEQIAVVIAPGLAFDLSGGRLGHGMGYYDRFLPKLSAAAKVWGVCYPWQLVAAVPMADFDRAMDCVIYE